MDKFVEEIVNGLTLGSVYALIAVGFSLIYQLLRVLNFAHGTVYMIGAFAGYGMLTLTHSLPLVLVFVLVLLAGMLGAGVVGVGVDRYAFKPLRSAPRTAALLVGVGVGFFLQSVILLTLGAGFRSYDTDSLGSGGLSKDSINAGPLHVSPIRIIVIVLAVAFILALAIVVDRTRLGRAIRATGYDPEAAAMMGVNVERVIVIGMLVASVLAGAAGVLGGFALGSINYLMGFNATLKGFSSAVIGGLTSLTGAVVGGLLIGLVETMVVGYLTATFQDVVIFAILIVIVLLKPSGLLGKPVLQKV